MTAVIPYFGYARKDRKDEGRVPISAKLVANMICSAGADRVLTIDLHAAQIQGFFDIPVDHLYAKPVLDRVLQEPRPEGPGDRRARHGRHEAGARLRRGARRARSRSSTSAASRPTRSTGSTSSARSTGKDALIIDDMIATGGSMVQAVRIVKEHGARTVYVGATHAVFCGDAVHKLAHCGADGIVITDTVPVHEPLPDRFQSRSVAGLLARAIKAIHHSESVSALFEKV